MITIEHFLQHLQFWIRSKPLLYRFTLGLRSLLAMGFIPTGMVKLLGYRFTTMNVETEVGAFFEVLYQAGPYWRFLGFTQVLAGVLVLIPTSSAIGALLFLGIMINIFFITISYDFAFTPVITFLMLLASIWLVIWDYNHFRNLLFNNKSLYGDNGSPDMKNPLPNPTLENSYERAVYITGTLAGILFFSMSRGLALHVGVDYGLLLVCVICFFSALVFAFRNTKENL